jgi:hypothetical protein
MKDVFHGWRRKAGVVLLGLALCLLALWFRSHAVADIVAVRIGIAIEVEISRGMINVIHNTVGYVDEGGVQHAWVPDGFSWRSVPPWTLMLQAGGPSMFGRATSYLRCSLLWFVASVTLLSAYLVLWKPQKRASTSARKDDK